MSLRVVSALLWAAVSHAAIVNIPFTGVLTFVRDDGGYLGGQFSREIWSPATFFTMRRIPTSSPETPNADTGTTRFPTSE